MLYSDYKSRTTVLVGIIPGGGFNFISEAYPGSTSDKEILNGRSQLSGAEVVRTQQIANERIHVDR